MNKTLRSLKQARQLLTEQGMTHNPDCRSDHEGWWYGDDTDALLDHSATITRLGKTSYAVTTFERKTKPAAVVTVTTEPTAKTIPVRTVDVPRGRRLNRHYNDDGSITLYAAGVKLIRLGGEEDGEDAEEAAEKYARRWFGSGKPVVWGKTTHGHNWKNRKVEPKTV